MKGHGAPNGERASRRDPQVRRQGPPRARSQKRRVHWRDRAGRHLPSREDQEMLGAEANPALPKQLGTAGKRREAVDTRAVTSSVSADLQMWGERARAPGRMLPQEDGPVPACPRGGRWAEDGVGVRAEATRPDC